MLLNKLFIGAGLLVGAVYLCAHSQSSTADDQDPAGPIAKKATAVQTSPEGVLGTYCIACHGPDKQKGKVRLDTLGTTDPVALKELFVKAQEAVHFEEMPPANAKQPSSAERKMLLDWLSDQLTGDEAKKLAERMLRPESGNYVKHEDLFSGEFADLPGYTGDRRWLISEFIFDAKINDLVDHQGVRTFDGKRVDVVGDNGVGLGTRFGGQSLRQSITNPFLLPSKIGVRYYDNDALAGGHLLTMISNAKKIGAYMASEQTMKAHYPAMHRIMQMELAHRETLRVRERFLSDHIQRLLENTYQAKHAELLPKFERAQVEDPPKRLDRNGNPAKKEDNLGLLARFDKQDLDAIYLGLNQYQAQGVSFDQVIERSERDWFNFGVHPKRITNRISIMKVLHEHWDMALIQADISKKNTQPPKYTPLNDKEMATITRALRTHRKQGDRYQAVIDKCMAQWEAAFKAERQAAGTADDAALGELVAELYAKILRRTPTAQETLDSTALIKLYLAKLDTQGAIAKLAESLLLSSEVVYRNEFGQGQADELGRRMMSPRDASYAIAYALTDSSPDEELARAASEGRLSTRADYRREVLRMLNRRDQFYIIDERVQKAGFNASITNQPIRKLRFFREFFGYPRAMDVFKDDARFGAGRHDGTVSRLIDEADLLVAHILEQDKRVFEELLSTEDFYVFHSGDNAAMQAASDRLRTIYDYFNQYDWENFTDEQLYEHMPFIKKMKMRGTVFPDFETNAKRRNSWPRSFQQTMRSLELRFAKGQKNAIPYDELPMAFWHKGNATGRTGQVMRGEQVASYFNIEYRDWDYPAQQPAKINNRKGILTHPAWLIAHSLNTETDPVRRGKWIREKLLAGTIPDVPITVDAVVPEDHTKTMRQRLEIRTGDAYCWNCHQKMDPLGLPFESYDDFGRYRTQERIEHEVNLITPQKEAPRIGGAQLAVYKTLPVDPRGVLDNSGDPALNGPVKDAFDLADRLVKSPRVRQSIIRHAFRYFMGRNETLNDSKTLIDAEKAYLQSGGSFDAVIVSLLTSDSFIYRKPSEN